MANAVKLLACLPARCDSVPDKWVCVGRKPSGVKVTKIYNEEILMYPHRERNETLAVRNVCPHRGARLSHKARVEDGCIRCAYHGMYWGKQNNPNGYLDTKQDEDLVWVNTGIGDGDSAFPSLPEFTDPLFRTFSYTGTVAGHPMIVMENLLDHAHLEHVHRVKIVESKQTEVTTEKSSLYSGKSVYTYPIANAWIARWIRKMFSVQDTGPLSLSVDNEFFLPYTASLRFKVSGQSRAVFVLWFSLQPFEERKSLLTCRVSRSIMVDPRWDWIFYGLNALPLFEDDEIIANVVVGDWWRNRLTPNDALVKMYRDKMRSVYGISFPEPFS